MGAFIPESRGAIPAVGGNIGGGILMNGGVSWEGDRPPETPNQTAAKQRDTIVASVAAPPKKRAKSKLTAQQRADRRAQAVTQVTK